MTYKKPLLATAGLAIAMSASTAIVTPEPVHAFDFKKITKKLKKNNQKIKRKFKKTSRKIKSAVNKPSTKKLLQGAGAALIIGGIARDSPAAAIIGVALVAAPELIKKDIAKSYKNDLNWSGCTRCAKSKPKAVTVPGRKINKKQAAESISRVKEDIKDVQLALKELGLYKKGIDGDFGPGTRAGVKEFQRSLGAKETGVLTAEERHRLFIQAEQKGYTRQAVLNTIDEDKKKKVSTLPTAVAVATPAVLAPALIPQTENTIEEYLLAKSQFETFNKEYLQSGNQSLVTDANLLPDGKIELTVQNANGVESKTLTGVINDIAVNPHKLSDQWIRIVFADGSQSEPIILNTRDDFPSTEAASNWMSQAYGKINILAKLTEVEPKKPEVRIASADPEQPIASAEPKVTEPEQTPDPEQTSEPEISAEPETPKQYKAGSDGKIIIADTEPAQQTQAPEPVSIASTETETETETEATPKPIKVSLQTEEIPANTLTGFDPQQGADVCQQNIYVSFSFPDGDDPISHYNIVPPEGTIMIDNGDSTAYFTGNCIQGNYGFSYVYIQEAAKQKDWKHHQREGSFQIASNSEQCSIDLNTPEQSAQLQCF